MNLRSFFTGQRGIGRQYLGLGLFFLLLGGTGLSVIVWLWPVPDYFDDDPTYLLNYFGRMRGDLLVYFGIIPILFSGLGNVMLSMGRGATMRGPRLQGPGLVLFYLSAAMILSGLVFREDWIRMVALLLNLTSGLFCSLSFMGTIVTRWRSGAAGFRFPVMVGTLFATAALGLVDFLLMQVWSFVVLMAMWRGWGRTLLTQVYGEWTDSAFGRHVFWFMGHPEIFVMLLFVVGVMGEVARWMGRRFFWRRAAATG